jgi:hypothetical protein
MQNDGFGLNPCNQLPFWKSSQQQAGDGRASGCKVLAGSFVSVKNAWGASTAVCFLSPGVGDYQGYPRMLSLGNTW